MTWTYKRIRRRIINVFNDGVYAGWLELEWRRTPGLHSRRIACWTGKVSGRVIRETGLVAAKAKIEACDNLSSDCP